MEVKNVSRDARRILPRLPGRASGKMDGPIFTQIGFAFRRFLVQDIAALELVYSFRLEGRLQGFF
jgi:hypothetical protein